MSLARQSHVEGLHWGHVSIRLDLGTRGVARPRNTFLSLDRRHRSWHRPRSLDNWKWKFVARRRNIARCHGITTSWMRCLSLVLYFLCGAANRNRTLTILWKHWPMRCQGKRHVLPYVHGRENNNKCLAWGIWCWCHHLVELIENKSSKNFPIKLICANM